MINYNFPGIERDIRKTHSTVRKMAMWKYRKRRDLNIKGRLPPPVVFNLAMGGGGLTARGGLTERRADDSPVAVGEREERTGNLSLLP